MTEGQKSVGKNRYTDLEFFRRMQADVAKRG